MDILDKNEPIMISIFKDGRKYYESHTITIVGYDTFEDRDNNEITMLLVFDNWHKTIYYLDYEVLNPICEICYQKLQYFFTIIKEKKEKRI